MLFTIQLPKMDAAEFTPSGALIFDAYATGVGVFQYTLADGRIVNEYKSLDEVAKPQSLATIAGSWITVHHPPQFLDSDTWKQWAVGAFLTPGTMDGRRVKTRGILYDNATINQVLNGELTEISMGYWQQPVSKTGSFDGLAFEIEQTDMMYNHGSLYETGGGRLGPSIGVKLDGKHWRQHASFRTTQNIDSKPKESNTMIIDFGGAKVDIPDAQAPQVQAFLQSVDSKINTLTTERDTAKGQATALQSAQTSQDEASKQAEFESKVQAAADARAELVTSSKEILPENYDCKGKSNRQIMADSLDVLGVKVSDKASDIEVSAAYQTAMTLAKNNDSFKSPVQDLISRLGAQGRSDSRSGFVPFSKRADGQKKDALEELEAMNHHYNNPRNYASGGVK